jgi:hypothetical protein
MAGFVMLFESQLYNMNRMADEQEIREIVTNSLPK